MIKQKTKAFTLAEVLVTLMIIGVISALTIPTLKETADRSANLAALQKAYSTATNAFATLKAEYGAPIYWMVPSDAQNAPSGIKGQRVFKDGTDQGFSWMLKQKISVGQQSGIPPAGYKIKKLSGAEMSTAKIGQTEINLSDLSGNVSFQSADNMYWFPSKTYSGCKYTIDLKSQYAGSANKNNSAVQYRGTKSHLDIFGAPAYALPISSSASSNLHKFNNVVHICGHIIVDTNGAKAPNRMGIDVFVFDVSSDGVIPHTGNDDCKDMTGDGYTCSSKLINGDEHALDFIYE